MNVHSNEEVEHAEKGNFLLNFNQLDIEKIDKITGKERKTIK